MHSSSRSSAVLIRAQASLLRGARDLVGRLGEWQQRRRSRRQLAQLDARQLADAGISHAERCTELDKPFWR